MPIVSAIHNRERERLTSLSDTTKHTDQKALLVNLQLRQSGKLTRAVG